MADSISALPIALNYKVENHYDGPATYFRGAVSEYVKKWCSENGYDLYRDGLKIYTTIDSRLQTLAEQAMDKRMRDLQKKFKRHWGDKNPWVDDKDQEIPGFLEASMKRTEYYKTLKKKFNRYWAKNGFGTAQTRLSAWRAILNNYWNAADALHIWSESQDSPVARAEPAAIRTWCWRRPS